MRYFLITYDRLRGQIEDLREFESDAEALDERFRLERANAGDDNIEIVVLGAASKEALRKTHRRYFATSLGDLIAG